MPSTLLTSTAGPPKRPLNAYMEYTAFRREELIRDSPGLANRQIISRIAGEWRELNPKQKKPFTDRAMANRKRYEREVSKWKTENGELPRISYSRSTSRRRASGYNLYIKSQFENIKKKQG